MVSDEQKNILKFIKANASANTFKLFDFEDFFCFVEEKNKKYVKQQILALERLGFVLVKYTDENLICLCALKKNLEEKPHQKEVIEKIVQTKVNYWLIFAMDFVACLIVWLVFFFLL